MKFFKYLFIALVIIFGICKLEFVDDVSVDDLKIKYAQAPSKFISIGNIKVHYKSEGVENDTLPLVLLHSTAASLHTFDAWVNELKQYKKVIRLDLPAFGLTGPFEDRNYKISQYT